jgi:hypothetical protein
LGVPSANQKGLEKQDGQLKTVFSKQIFVLRRRHDFEVLLHHRREKLNLFFRDASSSHQGFPVLHDIFSCIRREISAQFGRNEIASLFETFRNPRHNTSSFFFRSVVQDKKAKSGIETFALGHILNEAIDELAAVSQPKALETFSANL